MPDEGCMINDDALKYDLQAIAVCAIHLFLLGIKLLKYEWLFN